MANTATENLVAASLPLAGTELVHIVQGGNSRKVAVSALLGTGLAALELFSAQLALELSDVSNQALFLGPSGNRFADSFDNLTYVDVAGATNLNSGTPGVLKPTATAGAEQIPTMTGATTSGVTMSASTEYGAGNEAWRAGNKSSTGIWLSAAGVNGTLNIDLGSTKTITNYTVQNDSGYQDGMTRAWQMQVATQSNYSDAITVDTRTGQFVSGGLVQNAYAVATPVAGRYIRFVTTARGGDYSGFYEVGLQTAGVTNNLTVRSASFTAAAVPTKAKALIIVKEVDAAVAGTDYTLEASRDSGTTNTLMTLTELYSLPNGLRFVEAAETSIAGQPSGTSPRWRFKTLNTKNVELHAVYFYWSN